jgi:hypothetical protein
MISFTKTLVSAALASAMISPVKAQTTKTSFLEAALFFLTGVEPTDEDSVTDREIILRREPLVAHLVDENPCAVRLRNTRNNTVWQMDFCKSPNTDGCGGTQLTTQATFGSAGRMLSVFHGNGASARIILTQTSRKS